MQREASNQQPCLSRGSVVLASTASMKHQRELVFLKGEMIQEEGQHL